MLQIKFFTWKIEGGFTLSGHLPGYATVNRHTDRQTNKQHAYKIKK